MKDSELFLDGDGGRAILKMLNLLQAPCRILSR